MSSGKEGMQRVEEEEEDTVLLLRLLLRLLILLSLLWWAHAHSARATRQRVVLTDRHLFIA